MIQTTQALKEWAVAVDALAAGQTIVLLRKGGIREDAGRFSVAHRYVWLYPTYEHQNPQLLKPNYAVHVEPVSSGWHPETVPIRAWADITHIFQVTEAAQLDALQPFHIWNSQFAIERFRWKPRQPLYVLLLRTWSLDPISLPFSPDYGGCKSWIDLGQTWATKLEQRPAIASASPALSDDRYAEQVTAIETAIQTANPSNLTNC